VLKALPHLLMPASTHAAALRAETTTERRYGSVSYALQKTLPHAG